MNTPGNCEAILEHGRNWIVSRRGIKKWEELTFNYGCEFV